DIRNQWVNRRFYRTVGETNEEAGQQKAPEAGCGNGHYQTDHVACKRQVHQGASADEVIDQTAEHHRNGKAQKGHTVDPTQLRVAEVEADAEFGEDAGADRKG